MSKLVPFCAMIDVILTPRITSNRDVRSFPLHSNYFVQQNYDGIFKNIKYENTTLSSQEKENDVIKFRGTTMYSFQFDWFVEGEILDFPLSTIPTVSRYEKYGVFRKLHKSIELETVEWRKRQRRRRCVVGSIFFLKTFFSGARRLRIMTRRYWFGWSTFFF